MIDFNIASAIRLRTRKFRRPSLNFKIKGAKSAIMKRSKDKNMEKFCLNKKHCNVWTLVTAALVLIGLVTLVIIVLKKARLFSTRYAINENCCDDPDCDCNKEIEETDEEEDGARFVSDESLEK